MIYSSLFDRLLRMAERESRGGGDGTKDISFGQCEREREERVTQ